MNNEFTNDIETSDALKRTERSVRVTFPENETRTGIAQLVDTGYLYIISIRLHPSSQHAYGDVFMKADFAQRQVLEVRDACTNEILYTPPRTCNRYLEFILEHLNQARSELSDLLNDIAPNDQTITALDLDDLDKLETSFNSLKQAESYYAKIRTEIKQIRE